jgi:NAD-reducing hydrogenase small subunit
MSDTSSPPAEAPSAATKARVATVWLAGCSGCHMSFLDMDEFLFDVAERATVVYSPLVDIKEFPTDVDVTLVEGAVANEDNLELARVVRERSKAVVSFGDCAVNGNVTAMRNPLGDPIEILRKVYVDMPDRNGVLPFAPGIVPPLLSKVLPLHQVIPVDMYLPGCPPPAQRIKDAVLAILDGVPFAERDVDIRFG